MRFWRRALTIIIATLLSVGLWQAWKPMPDGLNYRGPARTLEAEDVRFLFDITAPNDTTGVHWSRQEIFEKVFTLIGEAESFIVADFFLINEFAGDADDALPLSRAFVYALLRAREQRPDLPIILISDPLNTLYGALEQPYFEELREADVEVVLTDLRKLRDSNLLYSPIWRTLLQWWGSPVGRLAPNPVAEGRIGLSAFLELLNFKANHRKVLTVGLGENKFAGLVTSGNPHSASAAHGNVALLVRGLPALDLLRTEEAVYRMSTGRSFPETIRRSLEHTEATKPSGGDALTLRVLTEKAILDEARNRIDNLKAGDQADLALFYFSELQLRNALARAQRRGADIRLLLDPNKDAFGRSKNGIPNRQVAAFLASRGVKVRWYQTSGEQFHTKMALFHDGAGTSTLLLGSANWTRRNLRNLNLETNVVVSGPGSVSALADADRYFNALWDNGGDGGDWIPDGVRTSLPFEAYQDEALHRRALYWLMERTGASTF